MKKRLVSMLLALCMVLSFVPTTAFAAGETDYGIWVGGKHVTSSALKGTGWSFDPATYTLTLRDGFRCSDTALFEGSKDHAAVIYATTSHDLTIKLEGDATVGAAGWENALTSNKKYLFGVYALNSRVTITGSHTLDIYGSETALWCKRLTVDGTELNCYSYYTAVKVCFDASSFLDKAATAGQNNDMVVQNGAAVYAGTTYGRGFRAHANYNGNYTRFNDYGGGAGIFVNGSLRVVNAMVDADNTCCDMPPYDEYVGDAREYKERVFCTSICVYGDLYVDGGDAFVSGRLTNKASNVVVNGATSKLGAVMAEKFCVNNGGTIEGFITNGYLTQTAQGLRQLEENGDPAVKISLSGNGSVRSGINRDEADVDLGTAAFEYVDRGGPYNPWETIAPTPDYNCYYEVYIDRATTAYFREIEGTLEWSYDIDYSATHPLDNTTIDLRNFANSVFVQNGWDPAWGAPELHFNYLSTWTVLPATDRAFNCELGYQATVTVQYENGQIYPGGTAYISRNATLNIQGNGISESWKILPYGKMGTDWGYVNFKSGTVKHAEPGSDIRAIIEGGNINYCPKNLSTTYGPGDNVHVYKTAYDISDCPDKVIQIVLTDSTIINASECYYYPIDNMLYVWAKEYVKVDYVSGERDRMYIKEDLGDGVYKMGWPDQYRELKANGNTKFYRDPDKSVTMTAGVIQTLEHWNGMLDPILLSETSTLADNQRAVWSYLNDNGETVVVGENSLTCTINDLSDIVGSRTYTCTVYETADNGSEIELGTYSGKVYVMRWKEGKTVVYSAPGEETTFTAEPSEECTWAMSPSPQWQVNKNDGNGWVNIDGATDASYTFTSTEENFNWKFRRNVNQMLIGAFDKGESNIYLDFSSREFSVTFAPEITGQPQYLVLYENTTKTYEMSVTARNAESYQWQKKLDGVFTDLEGETASTLKLTATIDNAGTYRCIVRNAYGETISAEEIAAWRTATTFSKITGYQVKLGETAKLSVDFENYHYDSVKWQYSTDDGTSWTDVIGECITDAENISMGLNMDFVPVEGGLYGTTTGAMLQILKTTADMNGWKARCVVYGSFGEYCSETVTLEIELPDCTVTFDANGGSGSMGAVTVKQDRSYTLPECGFTAPKGKQFVGWATSANGEVISDTAITVTENITLYAVWETIPTQEVSTGEELAAVLESNALSIKLMADITVSETITWSDKEITLDLNGHVLKNSSSAIVIQIKDGSSADITALILIDSNPTATHAGLPYKGGVIDDSIVVTTNGSGNNDCRLYANGGSVTGNVNLASGSSSIRCTNDTPTAFYGNASQYGKIYGGIFYGNTSLKTIKNPTLTFRYDDGNIYAREVLEAGKKVIALEDPTKTGYTFAGWDTEIPETMPASDLTATAKWTANKYDITYVGMDGVDDGQNYPNTHTYDTETVIPNPTKAGYTFSGWKVNGGATPVKDLTLGATDYTDDITLTAVWEEIPVTTYTVTFDANGGSGEMADVTGVSGSYTLPECGFTAPEGKQFKGWATSANGEVISDTAITVTEDTTLYAVWEDILYTVTFDANGGTGSMDAVTVVSGDSYTLPECGFTAPEGKQFKGWATSASGEVISGTTITVTGDTTLYAVWEDILYTVSFDANGGSGSMDAVTVVSGDSYTLPECGFTAPEGKQFKGWATSANGEVISGTTITVTEDTTLYAVWEDILYTVSFDANGGTGSMDAVTVVSGDSYTLPKCGFTAPEGKQFKGWATSASGEVISDTTITVTGDTTLYAVWEDIPVTTYTVSFNANGGSGSMDAVTVASGESYDLPECGFTAPEGKQFKGWATSANGEVISDTTITVTGDTTLYAVWEDIPVTTYTVSFNANGGSGSMDAVTVASGESYDLPECGFTAPEDKQFKGWATSENGEVISGTTIDVTEDITLYAVWENIPVTTYTVSFDANGGTGEMDDVTVTSGESYDLPECGFTAPEGKQFKGWATSANGEVISAAITVTEDTTLYAIWSEPESVPSTPVKPSWKEWLDKIFGGWWGDEEEEECDHVYTSVVTEPTCEEKGYTTHTCEKCGDSYKDSYTDALGHTWNEGEVTKESTCTEDGEMAFTCETCGETKTEKIEAPGHTFEDGVCTECGAEEPSEPSEPDDSGNSFWDNFWDWLKGWWN